VRPQPEHDPTYLDMQAQIGITKHNGGYPATDRLLEMCRAPQARAVLYVGSGIGVGPSHIARSFGCRVAALDVSAKMLDWTRIRTRSDGVADLVSGVQADVLALPFPDGPAVNASVDAVATGMQNVVLSDLWRGWFCCLEFGTAPGGA